MTHLLSNKWLLIALRIFVGAIFVYAGATKIGNPERFADSIASFQILPNYLINIIAMGLPPFELLSGLMMITGWHWRAGNLAILIMSIMFAIALGRGLARGLEIDCGCFGEGNPSPAKTWVSFGRDIVILVAAYITYRSQPCSQPDTGADFDALDSVSE